MAEQNPQPDNLNDSKTVDLISLEESLGAPSDPSANSQDSILNAASVFEAQLEQMTAWKHQLAQQMEVLRRDGIRVLERQKNLAIERKKLNEEREQILANREYVQKLHRDLEEENKKFAERGATLELAQAALDTTAQTLNQREAELKARENALQEHEIKFLEQDVQLKSALEQLEAQRQQLCEAQRQLAREQEALSLHQQEVERAAKSDQTILNERWAAIEVRTNELAASEEAAIAKLSELSTREQQLLTEKHSVDQAQARLLTQQEDLIKAEIELDEKRAKAAAELTSSNTAAEAFRTELTAERQNLKVERDKLQTRIDSLENDYAEQLSTLANQSKKLTERRAEIEARIQEIEKEADARIARATASLGEGAAGIEKIHADYQSQLQAAAARESETLENITGLKAKIENLTTELTSLRQQLAANTDELAAANRERTDLTRLLAEQVMRYEQDAAEWQRKLNESAAAPDPASTTQLQQLLEKSAQDEREIQTLRASLAQLEVTSAQVAAQLTAANSAREKDESTISNQLSVLEAQRNDLIEQLYAIKDALCLQNEEAALAKTAFEAQLATSAEQIQSLEAEKSAWQSQPQIPQSPLSTEPNATPQQLTTLSGRRAKLIRQARMVRTFRKQIRENKSTLEKNRTDIAAQREQLRTRKENLEQVKRLLEKQEMVMARKLADHNALKTVAAVGIFVIMILGSVFFGVYKFVNPNFRSEAVVQLATPPASDSGAPLQNADLQNWLTKQSDFVRSPEVTFAAWKILRTPEEHYAMNDVREEWIASLPKNLALTVDPATRTLSIQYTGQNPDGVAQVANALAVAFTNPTSRENSTPQTITIGAGANVAAKAIAPSTPIDDNRLMISLSGVAVVLFLSLILVILFRHYVARQLREIDDMADEKDLDDIAGDLPSQANPI